MEYGSVPGVGKPISRVVQGLTMTSTDRVEESFELLDAVCQAGVNTFDSGHVYGGGKCDRVFGQWVASRGLRDKVVLLDKGCHHNADRKRVTPFDLRADLFDCLARLGFDYIDMFALHRDDPSVPVGPIIEAFNEHLAAGRIKAFGASNWSHRRIAEANEYAAARGLTGMAFSSPQYSLAECYEDPWGDTVAITGPANKDAQDWYRRTGMPVFAWSSLAGGFFSGRFRRDNLGSFQDPADQRCVRCFCREGNFQRLDRAEQLARSKGATPPQIALAYAIGGPLNAFPLMAAYTPDQARENAAAASIELTGEQIAWLDLRRDRP